MNPFEFQNTIAIVIDDSTVDYLQDILGIWLKQNTNNYHLIINLSKEKIDFEDENYKVTNFAIPHKNKLDQLSKAFDFAVLSSPTDNLIIANNAVLPNRTELIELVTSIKRLNSKKVVVHYFQEKTINEKTTTLISDKLIALHVPTIQALGAQFTFDPYLRAKKKQWEDLETTNATFVFQSYLEKMNVETSRIGNMLDLDILYIDKNITCVISEDVASVIEEALSLTKLNYSEDVTIDLKPTTINNKSKSHLPFCSHGDPDCPCRSGGQCRYTPDDKGLYIACYRTGRMTGACCGVQSTGLTQHNGQIVNAPIKNNKHTATLSSVLREARVRIG